MSRRFTVSIAVPPTSPSSGWDLPIIAAPIAAISPVVSGAEVDAALVHHYYGTKEQLFAAAVRLPIDPMDVISPLREVPVEELGYQLPSVLLPLYDSELGAGIIATLRSILAGSEVNLFRSFLQEVIAVEVGSRVDNPPGSGIIRIQFVASQLVGVIMARYILQLEPFTSLPAEQIAQTIGPNLQRYLTGDLPLIGDLLEWPAP
jgi:AcrR family transcriptional regulator